MPTFDNSHGALRTRGYNSGAPYNRFYPKATAAKIAAEIVEAGYSEGWQGSLQEVATLEKILAPFNIGYVDDLRGKWMHTKSLTQRQRMIAGDDPLDT